MTNEERFFAAVARRRLIRPAVRAIIHAEDRYLVQRPADTPDGHFAFIGGEYEVGDTLESRIRKEIDEETSARAVSASYLFVVENRFRSGGNVIQTLEHYFAVTLDRTEVVSKERHLEQVWIDAQDFPKADIRPKIVRDLIAAGDWKDVRHLIVELED